MPASWRTSELTLLALVMAGTVLLTATSFFLAPKDTIPRNDGSSYAVHPEGSKAAFLLLKDLGYNVERSFEPIAAFRGVASQTTFVFADPTQPLSEQDRRAIRTVLEHGAVVLTTGVGASDFLPGTTKTDRRLSRERQQSAALPSRLSMGVPQIEMPSATSPVPVDSPYVVVYGTYEAPAVMTARIGQGQAIWWAASTPLVNGGVAHPGHAELLVNALGPPGSRRVLWDEFYHGYKRSFWSYLAGTPLPFAGLQLAAIVAAAVFTYSRRHRPIRARVVEPRTSPLEFIDTMGGLYERAKAANAAVGTLYARTRSRLLAAAGAAASVSDERLVSVAAERLSFDAGELSALLARARDAAATPALSEADAVQVASDLQQLAPRRPPGLKSQQERGQTQV